MLKIGLKTSNSGIDFLIKEEGLILKPYNDSSKFATIGVGHLIGKRPVTKEDEEKYKKFSKVDATNLLIADLKITEDSINKNVKLEIAQHQFDALVSLVFNIGTTNFEKSSLLVNLNLAKFMAVGEDFKLYCKSAGKRVEALFKRRCRESILFLEGKYGL